MPTVSFSILLFVFFCAVRIFYERVYKFFICFLLPLYFMFISGNCLIIVFIAIIVYTYPCICVYIWLMWTYISLYIYTNYWKLNVYECMCLYECVYINMHLNKQINSWMYLCGHVFICVHLNVCIQACIWTYVCVVISKSWSYVVYIWMFISE